MRVIEVVAVALLRSERGVLVVVGAVSIGTLNLEHCGSSTKK